MSESDGNREEMVSVGTGEVDAGEVDAEEDTAVGVPALDDDYLTRVASRLRYSYDLEADHRAGGEQFDLYAHLAVENQRQFLHRSINWANHESREHVFIRRTNDVSTTDLDRLVEMAHEIADDRIEADETHQVTEFTFVLIVPDVPADVRSYVDGFRDRTLLRFGYYGHYEVNLVVVAPDREEAVASELAAIVEAFTPWEQGDEMDSTDESGSTGVISRLARWLQS